MKKNLSDKLNNTVASVTLGIASVTAELKKQGKKIYSFSIGEPDFQTGEALKSGAIYAVNNGMSKYTDVKGYEDVREAIAEKLYAENKVMYSADQIIMTSGAKQALFTSLQALVSTEDEVIVPAPYWVSYCEMIKLAGGIPVVINTDPKNDFKLTAIELSDYITDKTKAVLINNPGNPVGSVYSQKELNDIAQLCVKNGIYIICDEIYEKFLYDGKTHCSIASLSDEIKDITLTVNGLSKTYAVPGWRLGYVAANKEIIKAMSVIQGHCISHPSTISQIAAKYALKANQSFVDDMLSEYARRRTLMIKKLDTINDISYIKPYGAFYFFICIKDLLGRKYNDKVINDSASFCELLLEKKHVAMVPGSGFGTEGYVRAAYTSAYEDIDAGLDLFKEFIENII